MRKVYATRQKTIVSESASFTEKGKSKIEGTYMYICTYQCVIQDLLLGGVGVCPPGKKVIFTSQKLVLNIMKYNIIVDMTIRKCILLLV